jgi:hypothetical protein
MVFTFTLWPSTFLFSETYHALTVRPKLGRFRLTAITSFSPYAWEVQHRRLTISSFLTFLRCFHHDSPVGISLKDRLLSKRGMEVAHLFLDVAAMRLRWASTAIALAFGSYLSSNSSKNSPQLGF